MMAHPLAAPNNIHKAMAFIHGAFGLRQPAGPTPTATGANTPDPQPDHAFPALEVPDINVFLQPAKTTSSEDQGCWSNEKSHQEAITARQRDIDNKRRVGEGTRKWQTAAQTHFADEHYACHLDADWKRMVEVLLFRFGRVDNDMPEALIARFPASYVNGSNHNPIMAKLTSNARRRPYC